MGGWIQFAIGLWSFYIWYIPSFFDDWRIRVILFYVVGVVVDVGVVVVFFGVADSGFAIVVKVVGIVAVVVIIVAAVVVVSFKMFIFENDRLLAFTGRFPTYIH